MDMDLSRIALERYMKEMPNANKEQIEKIFTDFYEKGIPIYQSIGLNDDFMKFLYSTAYQMYQSGKFNEAIANFQVLSTFDPTEPKYALGMALCYKEMKKYPHAIEELLQCTSINPEDPIPYWHLYECFVEINEPWGAGSALGAVIYLCDQTQTNTDLKKRAEIALQQVSKETLSLSKNEEATKGGSKK